MFGCCGSLFYKAELHDEERREERRRGKKEINKRETAGVDQCSIGRTDCSSPEQRNDSNMIMSDSTLVPGKINSMLVNFTSTYLLNLGLIWTARSVRNMRPATAIRTRAGVSRQRQRIYGYTYSSCRLVPLVLSSRHGPPQHHRLLCPD